jgi:hypothetical protein
MPTAAEYESLIKTHGWKELSKLWQAIQGRNTPGWDKGKAFEYLVLRMFDLNGAEVRWPFEVQLFEGETIEQIDGSVRINNLYCLLESKDEEAKISTGPVAKLRNQLLRRPAGTVGFLFSSNTFTIPAIQLAHFALPQTILLWEGDDVTRALKENTICMFAEQKYRLCVDRGVPYYSIREL